MPAHSTFAAYIQKIQDVALRYSHLEASGCIYSSMRINFEATHHKSALTGRLVLSPVNYGRLQVLPSLIHDRAVGST